MIEEERREKRPTNPLPIPPRSLPSQPFFSRPIHPRSDPSSRSLLKDEQVKTEVFEKVQKRRRHTLHFRSF